MAEIQCYSCYGVPGPTNNLRFKCLKNFHPLCQNCKWSRCPCRSEVGPNYCRITQMLLDNIPWYCCHYKYGCREMFNGESALVEHQDDCIYRPVRCCHASCRAKISFKDFLDHYNRCRPRKAQIIKNYKHSVRFKIDKSDKNGDVWFPTQYQAYGNAFFFVFVRRQGYYQMWMLMLTSSQEVLKNYEWNLRIFANEKEELIFRGEIFPIDKEPRQVLEEQSGFSIGCRKALAIYNQLGKFEVMIEIRNFKAQFKNEDGESGVSSDSELSTSP